MLGPHACSDLVVQADLDVIQHRQSLNRRIFWKVRAMPGLLICSGFLPVMSLPSRHDVALGGLIDAGQHVEHGGLARAVGADQAVQMDPFRSCISSSTACRPPNAMPRLLTSSSAMLRRPFLLLAFSVRQNPCPRHLPCGSARSRLRRANPFGALVEDHHDDQHDGVDQHTVIVQAAQHLGQNGQHGGGDDRAAQMLPMPPRTTNTRMRMEVL